MAIFVSNPTSVASTTLSTDALDPAVMSPEEGFTEELAAAMLPSVAPTDAPAKSPFDILEEAGKKASDLQILPAEVLLNAVGDANFAFASQAGAAHSAAQNSVSESALTETSKTIELDSTAIDLVNQLQGAELAAANLAAQMSAAVVNVSVPTASNSAEVSAAISVTATSGSGQEANQISQAPMTGTRLQDGEQVAFSSTLASAQNTPSLGKENINSAMAPTGTQAVRMAPVATTQADLAKSVQSDATRDVSQVNAEASNYLKPDVLQPEADVKQAAIVNQASLQTNTQVAVDRSLTIKSETVSVTAQVSKDAETSAVVTSSASTVASPQSASKVGLTVANSSDAQITITDSTQAAPITTSSPNQSIENTELATQKTTASSETKVDAQATLGQESSFNFDAKLGKSNVQQNSKALETAVSLAGVAKLNAQVENITLASESIELDVDGVASVSASQNIDSDSTIFSNVPSGMKTGRTGEAFTVTSSSLTASTDSTHRMDPAALTAANSSSTVLEQEAPRPETVQSLEDISSSFVSSLVGGPQRPVNTVMDWISMQSQELPAPLVPHEVRLDAGAVQLEIQKMVKQGGGHVVMELTPPDQSKFTIELKLDERGNALLIVEGVSDSTKTRLEQSAPQLREQFQQMGLELQLDMRQQGQSASSNAADFASSQQRGSGDNNLAGNGAGETPKVLTQREAGANRARETGSNQVYLYA